MYCAYGLLRYCYCVAKVILIFLFLEVLVKSLRILMTEVSKHISVLDIDFFYITVHKSVPNIDFTRPSNIIQSEEGEIQSFP